MAITLKKAKQELVKKMNAPLTAEELIIISNVENETDNKITSSFDGYSSINVSIKENSSFSDQQKHRVEMMVKELEKRYKKAGWDTQILHEADSINNGTEISKLVLSVKNENK